MKKKVNYVDARTAKERAEEPKTTITYASASSMEDWERSLAIEKRFPWMNAKERSEVMAEFVYQRENAHGDGIRAITSGKIPMGASQWLNHGKKYGYLDYFQLRYEVDIEGERRTRKFVHAMSGLLMCMGVAFIILALWMAAYPW